MKRTVIGFPLLVLLFAVVACGRAQNPNETATAIPTVDTDRIVAAVLTQIEEELTNQMPTAIPTVDVEMIKRQSPFVFLEDHERRAVYPFGVPYAEPGRYPLGKHGLSAAQVSAQSYYVSLMQGLPEPLAEPHRIFLRS